MPAYTEPFKTFTDDDGVYHELVYETIEIPPRPEPRPIVLRKLDRITIPDPSQPPPEIELEYETIEIPPRPDPAPLEKQHYEYLYYTKDIKVPFYRWVILGPKKLALDYITHVPVNVPPSGWIDPTISIVIEGERIEVFGVNLTVAVYSGQGSKKLGESKITSQTKRDRNEHETAGSPDPFTWYQRGDELFLELANSGIINLNRNARLMEAWDVPELTVHTGKGRHNFNAKTKPRPFSLPNGLSQFIRDLRKQDHEGS